MRRSRFFRACFACLLLAGVFSGTVAGQVSRARPPAQSLAVSPVSMEISPQLFAIMCALYASGYDAETTMRASDASSALLRQELLELKGPAVEALRGFYREHVLADPEENLSRYISLALVVGPPPRFDFLLGRDELPPDVLTLEGFNEILASFYKEAQLAQHWARVEPDYNREAASLAGPVRQIAAVTSGYLREIPKPVTGRTFRVLVEPLIGKRTNFRNYGEHYYIVVARGSDAPLGDIRHAYIHFMLDPLVLRYAGVVNGKKALLPVAARAPRLPVAYQQDFIALFNECLVKAVELRVRRPSATQLESELAESDRNGLVLVRPLVARLQIFEKAEPAMSLYFPDLVRGIDVAAEERRLLSFEFAAAEPPPAASDANSSSAQPSELEQLLSEGDYKIATRDGTGAAAIFERVLASYPGLLRATYGLAVASVLQGKGEEAERLFEQVIAAGAPTAAGSADPGDAGTAADPGIVAWSHIYLGRIHDLKDERVLALSEYHAALAVGGVPEAARVAAQRGIQTGYTPSAKSGNDRPRQP